MVEDSDTNNTTRRKKDDFLGVSASRWAVALGGLNLIAMMALFGLPKLMEWQKQLGSQFQQTSRQNQQQLPLDNTYNNGGNNGGNTYTNVQPPQSQQQRIEQPNTELELMEDGEMVEQGQPKVPIQHQQRRRGKYIDRDPFGNPDAIEQENAGVGPRYQGERSVRGYDLARINSGD